MAGRVIWTVVRVAIVSKDNSPGAQTGKPLGMGISGAKTAYGAGGGDRAPGGRAPGVRAWRNRSGRAARCGRAPAAADQGARDAGRGPDRRRRRARLAHL